MQEQQGLALSGKAENLTLEQLAQDQGADVFFLYLRLPQGAQLPAGFYVVRILRNPAEQWVAQLRNARNQVVKEVPATLEVHVQHHLGPGDVLVPLASIRRPSRCRRGVASASPRPALGFGNRPILYELRAPALLARRLVSGIEGGAIGLQVGPHRVVDEATDPLRRQLLFESPVDLIVHHNVQSNRHGALLLTLYCIQHPCTLQSQRGRQPARSFAAMISDAAAKRRSTRYGLFGYSMLCEDPKRGPSRTTALRSAQ